jgi:hypothetical protein
VTPVLRIRTTPALTRRLALVLAVLGALLIAWEAAPAGAVVTELEGSHATGMARSVRRGFTKNTRNSATSPTAL